MIKHHILFILILGLASMLFSQVSNYSFSEGTGVYQPLASYEVSTASGDNANQILALPFSFVYNDISYDNLCVVTNGYVKMGSSSTTSFSNTLSATASTRLDIVAPLWDDLFDDEVSEIRYSTLGSSPDRVFVIEWNGIYWNTSMGTAQNFQLLLYEGSNVIEFSYNLQEPSGWPSATIGINAAPGGSGRYLSVTPGNPSTVSSSSSYNIISGVSFLPSGKWYRFSPPDPNAPPAPAVLSAPTLGSEDNLEYTTFKWNPGSGNTAGYKFYLGTTETPVFVADLGNVTSYNHNSLLDFGSTYYWQVVPYNTINIDALNCPVWSFGTRTNPTVTIFPATWDFGASFSDPFPPDGWSKHSGLLSSPTTLGNNGSGAWSQYVWGNDYSLMDVVAGTDIYGQDQSWMITAPIAVPDGDYEIAFNLAYMEASSPSYPPQAGGYDDRFAVLISDGTAWTAANIARMWDNQASAYVLDSISPTGTFVSIPLGTAGTKYIAFYTESTEWNASNSLMIDDVMIRPIPSAPILSVNPDALNFDEVPLESSSDWFYVNVTNTGGGILELSEANFSLTGTDAADFEIDPAELPVSLAGGGSYMLPVRFSPLSEGDKSAELQISYNEDRDIFSVNLSGYAFELILDTPELHIAMDGDEIALEWDEIDGALSYWVYSSTNLADEDDWDLETVTEDLSYTLEALDEYRFFRVVASNASVDRGLRVLSAKPGNAR